jgi:hypothetical protein
MIHALVLFFGSIWPFHAKPAPPVPMSGERAIHANAACVYKDGVWFYLGQDKLVGLSAVSCEDAFRTWTTEGPIPSERQRLI